MSMAAVGVASAAVCVDDPVDGWPIGLAANPFDIRIGEAAGALYRGAVVHGVVVLAVGLAAVAAVVGGHFLLHRGHGGVLRDSLAFAQIPGSLLPVLLLACLCWGTAGVALLSHPQRTTYDLSLGIFVLLPGAALIGKLCIVTGLAPSIVFDVLLPSQLPAKLPPPLRWLVWPTHVLAARGTQSASGQRWLHLWSYYTRGTRRVEFAAVQTTAGFFLALLGSLVSAQPWACTARLLTILVVLVAHLVYTAVLLPIPIRFLWMVQCAVTGMLLLALLVALGGVWEASSVAAEAAVALVAMASVLLALGALVQLLQWLLATRFSTATEPPRTQDFTAWQMKHICNPPEGVDLDVHAASDDPPRPFTPPNREVENREDMATEFDGIGDLPAEG